jgi:hypothetical protein
MRRALLLAAPRRTLVARVADDDAAKTMHAGVAPGTFAGFRRATLPLAAATGSPWGRPATR